MRVLLVGEAGGCLDEGMKNSSHHLLQAFNRRADISASLMSPTECICRTSRVTKWEPQIIHYLHGPSVKSVLLARYLKLRVSTALVILSMTHPVLGALGKLLLSTWAPDHVFVLSREWEEWAKERSLPTTRFVTAGVDTRRFRPVSRQEKVRIREHLSLPLDKRVVLHVGHMRTDRNLTALVSCQQIAGIQVVILASSTMGTNNELLQGLRQAGCIVRLGYVPNVEWYYQSADCYVFPIVDKEAAITVPLSVLEAMSTNLPIVSTRFGGLTDIFQPCDGLKFVSAGLPSELVDAVKSATRLPNARTRQQVLPYDWRAVTRRLMEQYRTLGAGDSLREVAEVTV